MRVNTRLWIAQGVLAVLFLFAGGVKLVMPAAELTAETTLSAGFLRFIGVCELLGALGLVLPGLTGIRPALTALAAAGLTVIMVGAVATTIGQGVIPLAALPFATGLLALRVAFGRWPRSRRHAAS